jgi:hypothetical protein
MATSVHFCGGSHRVNGEENKVSTPKGKQIPGFTEPDQWKNFLDGFSKRNQGRATRLEVIGELGAQEEEQYLPLVGVSLDPKGTAAGSVEIMLAGEGPADDRHVEHTIRNVQKIAPLVGITGVEDGLGFEDQEGAKTLLIFEQLPELPAASA